MKSIKQSLCRTQFLVQVILIGLFCTLLYFYVQRALLRALETSLKTYGDTVAGQVEMEYEHGGLEVELEGVHGSKDDTSKYFIISNQKGIPVFVSKNINSFDWQIPQIDLDEIGSSTEIILPNGEQGIMLTSTFHPAIEDHGKSDLRWVVTVASPTTATQNTLDTLLVGSITSGFLIIALSVIVGKFHCQQKPTPTSFHQFSG